MQVSQRWLPSLKSYFKFRTLILKLKGASPDSNRRQYSLRLLVNIMFCNLAAVYEKGLTRPTERPETGLPSEIDLPLIDAYQIAFTKNITMPL